MKKIFIPIFAVAAMMATSCSDDELLSSDVYQSDFVDNIEVDFDADFNGLSKTYINHADEHKYYFEGNEKIAIYNNKNTVCKTLSNSSTTTSLKLKGTNPTVSGATQYYAVMPSTAAAGKVENGVIAVTLSDEQAIVDKNYDPKAHLFLAQTTSPTKYSFFTANSFLRLKNNSKLTFKTVTVTFYTNSEDEIPVNVVGTYNFDFSDRSFTEAGDNSNEIVLAGDDVTPESYFLVALKPMAGFNGYIEFEAVTEDGTSYCEGYDCAEDENPSLDFASNSFVTLTLNWWNQDDLNGNGIPDDEEKEEGDDNNQTEEPSTTINLNLNDLNWNTGLFTNAFHIVFDKKDNVTGNIEGVEPTLLKEGKIGVYQIYDNFNQDYELYVVSEGNEDIVMANSLAGMFQNSAITSIEFRNFNVEKVSSLENMFSGCTNLLALDLTGFNTASVKIMQNMFAGCTNLKTIFASDSFVVSDDCNTADMFSGCSALVGEKGTKLSDENPVVDGTYARLDTDENAGYFTTTGNVFNPESNGDNKNIGPASIGGLEPFELIPGATE